MAKSVESLSSSVLEIATGSITKLLVVIKARKSLKIVKPKQQKGGVFLGTMGQRFPF